MQRGAQDSTTGEADALDAIATAERLHAHGRPLARPVTNFVLDELARLIEQCDGDYLMSLVDLSVSQVTRPADAGDTDNQRAINARVIGIALGLPYETGRRKVLGLEAAGLCPRVTANRLAIVQGRLEPPAYLAECEARWRNLRTYLVELKDIGFDLGQFANVSAQTAVKAPTYVRTIQGRNRSLRDVLGARCGGHAHRQAVTRGRFARYPKE